MSLQNMFIFIVSKLKKKYDCFANAYSITLEL